MPKDESDPEDPLELCGVALATHEDTTEPMTECFIEEFLRLGHDHGKILALFRNPHYVGVNMVYQNRGEHFIRAKIAEVFAWWGRTVDWPESPPTRTTECVSANHQESVTGSRSETRPAPCPPAPPPGSPMTTPI